MMQYKENCDGIQVSNGYWECRHVRKRGGTIDAIRIFHAWNRNILAAPVSCRVMTAASFLDPEGPVEYRDEFDENAELAVEEIPDGSVMVKSKAGLMTAAGAFSGVTVLTEYVYRINRISIRRRFLFGEDSVELNRVTAVMIPCIPQLDRWTARRSPVTTAVNETAIQYQTQCGTNFPNLWGKFDSFITDYYEWRASSQLAIYTPDGPAVELMPDGNITGWDRSFAGPDGYCGYSYIKRLPAPRRHVMGVDPYFGEAMEKVRFNGEYEFRFELALPNVPENGFRKRALWLGSLLRLRSEAPWVTEQELEEMAENGVQVLIHHHDCPKGFGAWPDGSFYWPTGVFPPYDETRRLELKQLTAAAKKRGMKVIPYFNLFELHDSCLERMRHNSEWARLVNGKQNHSIYGFQTCLDSGFRQFLKEYIREVLSCFEMDGAYFDGVAPGYCENPRHAAGLPHYTVEGTLDIIEYTRKLIGEEGIIVIHNSGAPWLAAENLADMSVCMEYVTGFPNFEGGVPDLDSYDPMIWYGNVVPRSICGYTAIRFHDPDYERLCDKLAVSCLLNGIYFKGFSLNGVNEYERYKRLSRLMKGFAPGEFRFEKTGRFRLEAGACTAAAYISRSKAYVIVGNPMSGATEKCFLHFSAELFSWQGEIEVVNESGETMGTEFHVEVPGYSYVLYRVVLKN